MSVITAWKCDYTGKVFTDITKYRKHLRKTVAVRQTDRKKQQMIKSRDSVMEQMQQVLSIQELEQFVRDNWDWFSCNAVARDYRPNGEGAELVDIKIDRISWSNNLSNSHSCPRNGVKNFSGGLDKPTGYPGWMGYITFSVKSSRNYASELFEGTPIHTGSGGGGGQVAVGVRQYVYSLVLWADDFPAMLNAREQHRLTKHLGSTQQGAAEYQ